MQPYILSEQENKRLRYTAFNYPSDLEAEIQYLFKGNPTANKTVWTSTLPQIIFSLYSQNESAEDHFGNDTVQELFKGLSDKNHFSQNYWADWWLGFSKTQPFKREDLWHDQNRKYGKAIALLWKNKPDNYQEILQQKPSFLNHFNNNVLCDQKWTKKLIKLGNEGGQALIKYWQETMSSNYKNKPLFNLKKKNGDLLNEVSPSFFGEPWFLEWTQENMKDNDIWWATSALYIATRLEIKDKQLSFNTLEKFISNTRSKQLSSFIQEIEKNPHLLKSKFYSTPNEIDEFLKHKHSLERLALWKLNNTEQRFKIDAL